MEHATATLETKPEGKERRTWHYLLTPKVFENGSLPYLR